MTETEQPKRKPSILLAGVLGFLIAVLIGVVVSVLLAANAGWYNNVGGFQLLAALGALGAYSGYRYAVRQRKRLGVSEPNDEWQQFIGSTAFGLLAVL